MKRVLVIAVLTAALVAGATVAEAAIKKGTFTGKTSGSDPVGLSVKNNKVSSFYYEGVRLDCTDGDSLDTPTGSKRIQTPSATKFAISSKRKFSIVARTDSKGFGWEAKGKFNAKGSKVTGTLVVHAKFNDQNEQDPEGSITCTSKQGLTFSLNRK